MNRIAPAAGDGCGTRASGFSRARLPLPPWHPSEALRIWRAVAARPLALPAAAVCAGLLLAHALRPDARLLVPPVAALLAVTWRLRRGACSAALPLVLLATASALRATVADPFAASDSVARHAGNPCILLGTLVRATREEGRLSGVIEAERILLGEREERVSGKVRLLGASCAQSPCAGAPVAVEGELHPVRGPHNMEPYPWESLEAARGIAATLRKGRIRPLGEAPRAARWRAALIGRCDELLAGGMNDPERALLLSALFGAGSAAKETARSFADSGLLHLLVVSGQQVTLLSLALLRLLPGRAAAPAGIAGVLAYAFLCGADPAVFRASFMAVLLLAGRCLHRPADPLNSLFAAFLAIALLDPSAARAPGFWFTFLVTLAILIAGSHAPAPRRAAAVFAAANLASLPVALLFFGTAPLTGILAQIPAIALFDAALAAVALALPAAALLPAAAPLLFLPARIPAAALLRLADLFSDFRLALSTGEALLLLALLPAAWLALAAAAAPGRAMPGRERALRAGGACAAAALLYFPLYSSDAAIEFLDVGQGDAALLRAPGAALLVDAGDGRSGAFLRVVRPHLDRTGVRRLDALFLSHLDADHAGCAGAVARHSPRAAVYLPASVENTRALRKFLEEQAIPPRRVRFLARGDVIDIGQFHIEVHWPVRGEPCGDDNAGSLVFTATCGGVRALFPGDLTSAAEARLVALGLPPAHVLKASHHGAAGATSPAFLHAARPETAILSVAFPSRFGHPAPGTIRSLAAAGASVLSTADAGLVRISPGDGRYLVETSRRP